MKGDKQMNNDDAQGYCENNGGKIVEPRSDQDIKDLMSFTKGMGNMIRIGINDIEKKGT